MGKAIGGVGAAYYKKNGEKNFSEIMAAKLAMEVEASQD